MGYVRFVFTPQRVIWLSASLLCFHGNTSVPFILKSLCPCPFGCELNEYVWCCQVLKDGMLENLTPELFVDVNKPKSEGTVNLDR